MIHKVATNKVAVMYAGIHVLNPDTKQLKQCKGGSAKIFIHTTQINILPYSPISQESLFVEVFSPQSSLQLLIAGSTQGCQEGAPYPLLISGVMLFLQPAIEHVPARPMTVIGVVL